MISSYHCNVRVEFQWISIWYNFMKSGAVAPNHRFSNHQWNNGKVEFFRMHPVKLQPTCRPVRQQTWKGSPFSWGSWFSSFLSPGFPGTATSSQQLMMIVSPSKCSEDLRILLNYHEIHDLRCGFFFEILVAQVVVFTITTKWPGLSWGQLYCGSLLRIRIVQL